MIKNECYVLDTCIIIGDPELKNYQGKTVYIPIAVQKELDRHKTLEGDLGFKARVFFRKLKEVEDLTTPFYFFNEDVLVINPTNSLESCEAYVGDKADDWFINAHILDSNSYILHTHDFSLYNLVKLYNKSAVFLNQNKKISVDEFYSGKARIDVPFEDIEHFRTCGFLNYDKDDLFANQMVILNFNGYEQYGRYYKNQKRIVSLKNGDKKVWGAKARNPEQQFLVDVLLDDNIKVVSVSGTAGTGKTYLALASALEQTLHKPTYRKIYIAKDCTPVDKWNYLGFTKGDTEKKLETHFLSYKSTLESLALGKNDKEANGSKILEDLMTFNNVELLDIASIRGVTFRDSIILIDEFQSMNLTTAQAIITRIGEGAKIVFMGDLLQQTVDKLPPDKSGLFVIAEWLKDVDEVAHITLSKIERSSLVDKIANIFIEKIYG